MISQIRARSWAAAKQDGELLAFNLSILIVAQLANALSMQMRETIVRTIPIDRRLFTFQVSLLQLITGSLAVVIVLLGSQHGSNKALLKVQCPANFAPFEGEDEVTAMDYVAHYFRTGFGCLFAGSKAGGGSECSFALAYFVLYVCCQFLLIKTLHTLMLMGRAVAQRVQSILAISFFITMGAFASAQAVSATAASDSYELGFWDGASAVLVAAGVAAHHAYPKKQKKCEQAPRKRPRSQSNATVTTSVTSNNFQSYASRF